MDRIKYFCQHCVLTMTDLLQINHVVKKYSNHLALDDVSMSIPKGSVFGLLGPNGAGKTSLIRIINQITAPDSGEILFNGQNLQNSHVARIGYLPEERGLYKKMSVQDQVIYLARLKGLSLQEARKRTDYWFGRFEMNTWRKKKIEELSKGMQQKVQFIVTVIHEPELLILDEPFSGFDPINAQLIRNEILHLRDNGATVIFSTHNMGSVEELCDHIALLNKSRKILDGRVKDIRRNYRSNAYRVSFAGDPAVFESAVTPLGDIMERGAEDELNVITIKLKPELNANRLLQAMLPVCEVHSLTEIIPSMNDIFIMKVQEGAEVAGTKSNYTE